MHVNLFSHVPLKSFKLVHRQKATTNSVGTHPSNKGRLLHIFDTTTALNYLVDCGCQISLIPATLVDKRKGPDKLTLQAVNDTIINTSGQKCISLNFELQRSFKWVLTIADVPTPILGADFFQHFGILLIDMNIRRLVDPVTSLRRKGFIRATEQVSPSIACSATIT